jgi:hypothetical protein
MDKWQKYCRLIHGFKRNALSLDFRRSIQKNYCNFYWYVIGTIEYIVTLYVTNKRRHLDDAEKKYYTYRETKDDKQYTHKRTFQTRSFNSVCRGKAVSIKYSECVSVALIIQHAKRMRLVVLSFVALFLNLIS